MAVYKRTYKRYDGELTSPIARFLVIPRFHFEEMYRSRFLTLFFLGTMIYPLLCMALIYLQHNLSILATLNIPAPKSSEIIAIDERFFLMFLGWQSMLAFFMSSFVGPGLISPDLVNNALPLYLSRPATRAEYVLGKMTVLVALLSAMTWIPGTLVYLLQSTMEGGSWFGDHLNILGALFAGAWIWILVLSLLALALSAWVRLKPVEHDRIDHVQHTVTDGHGGYGVHPVAVGRYGHDRKRRCGSQPKSDDSVQVPVRHEQQLFGLIRCQHGRLTQVGFVGVRAQDSSGPVQTQHAAPDRVEHEHGVIAECPHPRTRSCRHVADPDQHVLTRVVPE